MVAVIVAVLGAVTGKQLVECPLAPDQAGELAAGDGNHGRWADGAEVLPCSAAEIRRVGQMAIKKIAPVQEGVHGTVAEQPRFPYRKLGDPSFDVFPTVTAGRVAKGFMRRTVAFVAVRLPRAEHFVADAVVE